jgi:TetR/AcrR family transcriptional regulator, transcriptional repressor for nem operon
MSRAEQKHQTRQRIAQAAGEQFRSAGFEGVGVDGLAKAAGVTSGAFYVHFASKSDAFLAALSAALDEVNNGILQLQQQDRKNWWTNFVAFYLGDRRRADLAHSCGLQTLAPEVARSNSAAVELFETGLRRIAATIANGPRSRRAPRTIDDALSALGTLIGTVTLTRAVADPSLADTIAATAQHHLTD